MQVPIVMISICVFCYKNNFGKSHQLHTRYQIIKIYKAPFITTLIIWLALFSSIGYFQLVDPGDKLPKPAFSAPVRNNASAVACQKIRLRGNRWGQPNTTPRGRWEAVNRVIIVRTGRYDNAQTRSLHDN